MDKQRVYELVNNINYCMEETRDICRLLGPVLGYGYHESPIIRWSPLKDYIQQKYVYSSVSYGVFVDIQIPIKWLGSDYNFLVESYLDKLEGKDIFSEGRWKDLQDRAQEVEGTIVRSFPIWQVTDNGDLGPVKPTLKNELTPQKEQDLLEGLSKTTPLIFSHHLETAMEYLNQTRERNPTIDRCAKPSFARESIFPPGYKSRSYAYEWRGFQDYLLSIGQLYLGYIGIGDEVVEGLVAINYKSFQVSTLKREREKYYSYSQILDLPLSLLWSKCLSEDMMSLVTSQGLSPIQRVKKELYELAQKLGSSITYL